MGNNADWEQELLEEELLEEELLQREFEDTPEPDDAPASDPVKPKHPWQVTKESWYDKLNVSVRQLDIVIGVASAALLIVVVLIVLDAMGLR